MRIFVTGASGYIGYAVACAFRRAGHQVLGLVRSETSAQLLRTQEIVPVLGDIGRPETFVVHAEKSEVLVHCALDTSADKVAKDERAIDALLLCARKSDHVHTIMYTSGIWVYGNSKEIVDESTPLNPLSLVSWRPNHENKILSVQSSNLRTVVIRPGCVYGGADGLTAIWFTQAAKKGHVAIIEDGSNRWAMVHRDDLASAYVIAAEKELSKVVLNITDGTHYTVREMAEAVCLAAGCPEQIVSIPYQKAVATYGPLAEGMAVDHKISNQRAIRLLDWHPRHASFIDEAPLYYAAWKR